MYDVIIIGAGPAGLTAGIYAAKNKLHTLVLSKDVPVADAAVPGGEGLGFVIANFKKFLESKDGYLELQKQIAVTSLEKNIVSFAVEDQTGKIYYARSVIVASGLDEKGFGQTSFDKITEKNVKEKIKVDVDMRTSVSGIFAAGAVIDGESADIFIASAEGAKASLSALNYLRNLK